MKILVSLCLIASAISSCSENNLEPQAELFLEVEQINANVRNVNTVCINNSGNYVAWGGQINDIRIKGEPSLKGHIGWINSLDFTRDGSLLVSGSDDHNIKLWDVKNTILLRTFSEHITVTRDVKITPDGKSVISAEDNYVVYWRDAINGSIGRLPLYGHTAAVNSVDMSYDMTTIISGCQDKTIKVWNAFTGDLIYTIDEHTANVKDVEFNPVALQFASCSADLTVKIWSLENFQLIRTLEGYYGAIFSVSYHPSGRYLAGGGTSNVVYIWDLTTGELIRSFDGHTKTITSVDFGENGNTIVSGGLDDKIIIRKNVFSPDKN